MDNIKITQKRPQKNVKSINILSFPNNKKKTRKYTQDFNWRANICTLTTLNTFLQGMQWKKNNSKTKKSLMFFNIIFSGVWKEIWALHLHRKPQPHSGNEFALPANGCQDNLNCKFIVESPQVALKLLNMEAKLPIPLPKPQPESWNALTWQLFSSSSSSERR